MNDIAHQAQQQESLDIREILTHIDNKQKGPKKVTIDPAMLSSVDSSECEFEVAETVQ